MQIPIDSNIKEIVDIPYTISYCIRKRSQVDSLTELPKDKRPTDQIIWYGTSDEIDDWMDRVYSNKEDTKLSLMVSDVES